MSRFVKWFHLIAIVLLVGPNQHERIGLEMANANPRKAVSLYSKKDDVIVLDVNSMKSRVYGKSMAWLIEFYNSWCGHCINFAPTWKTFASDLKGWRRVISVGAIDCASDDNVPLCREYDIQGYPSMKFFPPWFNEEKDKEKLTALRHSGLMEMKTAVLDYITNTTFTPPSSWPQLKPLKSLGDIWNEARDEHKFVVVIFEEEHSIVGRQVILDLVDYPSILVRSMWKKDVEKFGILHYPSLYIINKDSSFQILASGNGLVDADRHVFVDKMLSMLNLQDSQGHAIDVDHHKQAVQHMEMGNDVNVEPDEKQPATQTTVSSASKGVHMQDLESSLHYALRQEIAICKTIDGPKLDALRNFVSTLAKYFPGQAKITRFLWKVVEFLRKQDTALTGQTWIQMIEQLEEKEACLPDEVRWVGCQGSQPRYRGYPCSMWTLFHTLTVAAYENTGAVNALEVPLAIRGYMEHFFGCQECSHNFLKMASTMEKDIHRPLEAVLWLWAAHNKANKRLHGDASEDPLHPKIQFPSVQDCPECCSKHNLTSDKYPGWNVSAVTLFLIKLYSKENIIQDADIKSEDTSRPTIKGEKEMDWWEKQQRRNDLKKIRELREQKRKQKLERKVGLKNDIKREALGNRGQSVIQKQHDVAQGIDSHLIKRGWGLSNLDVGVCLIFYLGCAVIILVLYYHFIVHRKFRLPFSKCLPV